MRKKRMLHRFFQFAFFIALAGWMCCPLPAQSSANSPASSKAGPITVASYPAAPVGTSFNPADGTLQRPETRVAQSVGAGYRIGADDVLTINVWHEPEVSRNVPVRPDGRISLPLIGDVRAAGLTPMELQNELEARFAKFLTNPDVSVIVAEIRSQRINVLGQVLRPGTYPLIPPMSVVDAIADAGGLSEFAKANKAYVLRTLANGSRERIKFRYKDVLNGKRGSRDILLETRDTVVIP